MRGTMASTQTMAALEPHTVLIEDLFNSGLTHTEISCSLQQMGILQCSEMSVRRFCARHDLRRKRSMSDAELESALVQSMYEVSCHSDSHSI